MKTFLCLFITALSLNLSAFERTADLDFSNVYGNTDAGTYKMTIAFTPKTTESVAVIENGTERDDNDLYCTTSAVFEIGELTFSLVDVKTGWSKVITKKVNTQIGSRSNSETCNNSIEQFVGTQLVYSRLATDEAILLPVKAPFDYEAVGTYLAPFNGYLYLNATVALKNGKLVMDPSKLLTAESIDATNTRNNTVTYYVFAGKPATMLSLATGIQDLN